MSKTSRFALALVAFALTAPLAACGGDPAATPGDGGGQPDGGAAGSGAGGMAGSGGVSTQKLSFTKDGQPVAVDFSKWGTPAYYQKTSAGWTLAVVANEVQGTEGRYFSLLLRATDDAELAPGTYPCATRADGPKVLGQMTYSEANMTRVWKQAADAPCSITIDDIGPIDTGRLEGKFNATLKPTKGATEDVALADGVFDVKRKEY
jgi:hypothetical protein